MNTLPPLARAPLLVDGFLRQDEMDELLAAGAAGEICGWIYGEDGKLVPVAGSGE